MTETERRRLGMTMAEFDRLKRLERLMTMTRFDHFKEWLLNSPRAYEWICFVAIMLSAMPFLWFGSRG